MKFKRAIGLVLCVSMVVGCLAGCGKEERRDDSVDTNDYPFPVEDLGGYVFTVADSTIDRWEPQDGESEIGNAIIKRVETVEQLFNCKIERIDYDSEQASNAAMIGSKYADIIVCPTFAIGRWLLQSRALVDMSTLEGLNLDAEYWTRWGDTSIMKYHDKIYALGAPFACQHDETYVLFYNKAIIEELNLESPYDLYKKDEWTISKMLEYCKAAKADLNGDGVFDENDRYGYVGGNEFDAPFVIFMGAGGQFLKEEEDGHFSFALNTKDGFRLVNQVAEIMDPWENAYYCWGVHENTDLTKVFVDGKAMFYSYTRGRGMADAIYDMKDDFGIVPMPKGDDAGPDEYRCWVSHDAPQMGICSNNPDIDKTVMIVEALAYFSQEENEIEEGEYLANKLRDDESREIVSTVNKYATIDYGWVSWVLDEALGLTGMREVMEVVEDVTVRKREDKVMSRIQKIENLVDDSIEALEAALNQTDKY